MDLSYLPLELIYNICENNLTFDEIIHLSSINRSFRSKLGISKNQRLYVNAAIKQKTSSELILFVETAKEHSFVDVFKLFYPILFSSLNSEQKEFVLQIFYMTPKSKSVRSEEEEIDNMKKILNGDEIPKNVVRTSVGRGYHVPIDHYLRTGTPDTTLLEECLTIACRNNKITVIDKLIEFGININTGHLATAIKHSRKASTIRLLQTGVIFTDNDLHSIIKTKNLDFLDAVEKYFKQFPRNYYNERIFVNSVVYYSITQNLIETFFTFIVRFKPFKDCFKGFFIYCEDVNMFNKLCEYHLPDPIELVGVCHRGFHLVAKCMLEKGMDPNVDNGNALRLAAQFNHLETVQILLKYGANINARGPSKSAPVFGECDESILETAACWLALTQNGGKEILQLLLDSGAKISDVNEKNRIIVETRFLE